ncbi:hypothetical protein [Streptomyces gardneri]|uniref:hypothetical protein n=1 Tax=Streptomyces gardneri TaxID=66892 RepID=UPI0037D316D2
MNGKIVSVDTWDVNENKAALDTKAMDDIEKTVNNKMDPEVKRQTQNVVFWANSLEQAPAVAERLHGNANVRVIYSSGKLGETNLDTHKVLHGFKGTASRADGARGTSGVGPGRRSQGWWKGRTCRGPCRGGHGHHRPAHHGRPRNRLPGVPLR